MQIVFEVPYSIGWKGETYQPGLQSIPEDLAKVLGYKPPTETSTGTNGNPPTGETPSTETDENQPTGETSSIETDGNPQKVTSETSDSNRRRR
ncbi:MAG TPA: hypothetical protein VK203_02930 [Nostocaceae cyanobacterium]|nr:hypothetical protein [Nostocaceae cyanobacterium]